VALDFLVLALHVIRPHPDPVAERFDPAKLTIFIICYNGEEIIAETLRQAMRHVPPEQIIVVSDNSKDRTVEIAQSMGVRVVSNERNYNKSMSINRHIHNVKTPYVLILDDDTLIGKTFLPTSLLDAGYAAVAFDVRPVVTSKLANKFQQFEYLKSMVIRKGLRTTTASVGNVSGAIGMFYTDELKRQATLHSGQQGGEDQQRTILTHLSDHGKGVVFCNSAVYTLAPDSLRAVFNQRAFKWNTSAHENFMLILRAILHPKTHYMLKLEKSYALFILLTDPFRMMFFGLILFAPFGSFLTHMSLIFGLYILIELVAWQKTGRESPLWIVLLFPIYAKMCAIARFIAHFYWLKKKHLYIVRNKFHRLITGRRLLREYAALITVLLTLWTLAAYKLAVIQSSGLTAAKKTDYAIPQWQFLEFLPADLTAASIILVIVAALVVTAYARRLGRNIAKATRPIRRLATTTKLRGKLATETAPANGNAITT
jgi:cellulose synthase/poly-beta-1,6-N-acetylglucosamine synthase-like glycosyltransferase